VNRRCSLTVANGAAKWEFRQTQWNPGALKWPGNYGFWMHAEIGGMMVELLCKQGVAGSNPAVSTSPIESMLSAILAR